MGESGTIESCQVNMLKIFISPDFPSMQLGSDLWTTMAPLALLTNLHTKLSHMHCLIASDCPIGIIS